MHQQAIIEYRYPLCVAQERRYHNEVCFTWSVLLRHPIASYCFRGRRGR